MITSSDPVHPKKVPLLAVRDVVLFPHMALPISVGRPKSVAAVEASMRRTDKLIAVVAQKEAQIEDPQPEHLHAIGSLAEVSQFLKMPDGTLKIFIKGVARVKLGSVRLDSDAGCWEASCDYPEKISMVFLSKETKALMRHAADLFDDYLKISRRTLPEVTALLARLEDPSQLADVIAANAVIKMADRQAALEILDANLRLEKIIEILRAEIEIISLERKIHGRVRTQIEKSQKEYYLTEQIKAIQKELRQKDDFAQEVDALKKSVAEAKMPKVAEEAALKELSRLEKMMPYSPESTVARTYLDWMIHLPWSSRTRDRIDIEKAQEILDADHYDLKKIKDRILEYLAVCKLSKGLKGPILCFVGPPGVGKTSMGRSIAKSIGRKFVRMSLGGVRDEAEIRGHRRTYIGSLPGRIIQSLKKTGSKNPVFLLDEIDKMGTDWRGDPAAALLEVLDPEQNASFLDHYLDVEFDLSEVMFICTANTLEGIPVSLQDRLEILRFSGYTLTEKKNIARTHLIPRQVKDHGIKLEQIIISDDAVTRAIEEYTREAGVRNLDRELAALCRKSAVRLVKNPDEKILVEAAGIENFLGAPKFHREKNSFNGIGVSTGLAWTEVGGVTMAVEAAVVPGKGDLKLTGKLGSVMSESAHAAFSYVKSISRDMSVPEERLKNFDYHIHVPEAATPKDGPSAGIAIAVAIVSLMTERPVIPNIAMTGEITLRGRVLPIGGLKEKVMAAHREGIKIVIYPDQNQKDLEEIPKEILAELKMIPVKHFEDVIALALSPAQTQDASRATEIHHQAPFWMSQKQIPPPFTPPGPIS
ncbi:MAG: endopeptidase La [Elusimicrobiota bacterium]